MKIQPRSQILSPTRRETLVGSGHVSPRIYDFSGFNCNLLNKCKIKQYVDLTQKKYISYWNHTLQHSQKLNFYYKIKTNSSPSAYLDLTRKNPSRKTLVKLRISSHKLRIETGRYDNIPREERLCNLCNCNRIEDKTHFLLDCPSFSSIRDMFFSKLEPKIPFLRLQSHESLLSHLMNSGLVLKYGLSGKANIAVFLEIQRLQLAGSSSTVFAANLILYCCVKRGKYK